MSAAAGASDGWRAVRDGVVVGVTNPKAYTVRRDACRSSSIARPGTCRPRMLLLALVSVAIGLVSDSTWGLAASGVRAWFAGSPRRYELVGGAGGLAMIGVGVTVAVTGRRSRLTLTYALRATPPKKLW